MVQSVSDTADALLFGRFRYIRTLGEGGSATVFEVVDEAHPERPHRALKAVQPDAAPWVSTEFARVRKVHHPRVARVHELLRLTEPSGPSFGLARGTLLLLQALVEGVSADLAASRFVDPEARLRWVLAVGIAVAQGLEAVHQAGLVHGDVKPQNIVVGAKGEGATLVDFGLARLVGDASLSPRGTLTGTPAYMAPEAFFQRPRFASDVYALGATLYDLYTLAGALAGAGTSQPGSSVDIGVASDGTMIGPGTPPSRPLDCLDHPALRQALGPLLDPDPETRLADGGQAHTFLSQVLEAYEGGTPIRVNVDGVRLSQRDGVAWLRHPPLVGRDGELEALVRHLQEAPVVWVTGPMGVGRRRLVQEAVAELQRQVGTASRSERESESWAREVVPSPPMLWGTFDVPLDVDAVVTLEQTDPRLPELSARVRDARARGRFLRYAIIGAEGPADETIAQVCLAPLGADDVKALADRVLPEPLSAPRLRALMQQTAGLPGRVRVALTRQLSPQPRAGFGVSPAEAEELFGELTDAEATWLSRLAVATVACPLSGLSPADHAALDELRQRGLVLVQEGGLCARRDVSHAQRVHMGRDERARVTSELCACLPDGARAHSPALDISLLAGEGRLREAAERGRAQVRKMLNQGRHEEAAELLALKGGWDAEGDEVAAAIWVDASSHYEASRGRFAEALSWLRRAEATPECAPDGDRESYWSVRAASYLRRVGDHGGLRARVDAVLGHAPEGSMAHGAALRLLARSAFDERDFERCAGLLATIDAQGGTSVEALLRLHADLPEELRPLSVYGVETALLLGVYAQGQIPETTRDQAARLVDALPETAAVARARLLNVLALVYRSQGASSLSLAAFARAEESAAKGSDAVLYGHAEVNYGTALLDRGDLGGATAHLRRGVRVLLEVGAARDASRALYNLGTALLLCGEAVQADWALEEALREDSIDPETRAFATVARMETALLLGRTAEVRRLADAAQGGSLTESLRWRVGARVCLCLHQLGDHEKARDILNTLPEPDDEAHVLEGELRAELSLTFARHALADGDGTRAVALSVMAANLLREAGTFGMRVRTLGGAMELTRVAGQAEMSAGLGRELRGLLEAALDSVPLDQRARMRAMPTYRRALSQSTEGNGAVRLLSRRGEASRDPLVTSLVAISMARTLKGVVMAFLEGVLRCSGAERAMIVRDADPMSVPFARTDAGPIPREARFFSTSVVRRALETQGRVWATDALTHELLKAARSVHAMQVRSVLAYPLPALPLRSGEGEAAYPHVLYVDDRLRPDALDEGSAKILAPLVQVFVASLARVQALRQEQRVRHRLARRAEALEVEVAQQREAYPAEAGEQALKALVGESPVMRAMRRRVRRVAPSDVPVLILGESGTGKELVARAIHALSDRAEGPWVAENCGAVPEALMESVLFGHAKGAFTGAHRDHRGLFELADGGTLFLDEVAEMPLSMQAKLLRVLQAKEVRRVGDGRVRPVNVRIVAATHHDLRARVASGAFREDLFYRLAVVDVSVPALRERLEDLPVLVHHFVAREAAGAHLDPQWIESLRGEALSGNVRELENLVRRQLLLGGANAVALSDGRGALATKARTEELPVAAADPLKVGDRPLGDDLDMRTHVDALERHLITEALKRTDGNQTRAARLLGVSRYGLQKMLKRLAL